MFCCFCCCFCFCFILVRAGKRRNNRENMYMVCSFPVGTIFLLSSFEQVAYACMYRCVCVCVRAHRAFVAVMGEG